MLHDLNLELLSIQDFSLPFMVAFISGQAFVDFCISFTNGSEN